MLEPLTLTLLALPGDPGDVLGPVLEHPEVFPAMGRKGHDGERWTGRRKRVQRVDAKLSRVGEILSGRSPGTRKGSELRKRYPERKRERLLSLYRRVRLYYRTVFDELVRLLVALLVTFFMVCLAVKAAGEDSVANLFRLAGISIIVDIVALIAFCEIVLTAVEDFADAVLAGESPEAALDAFYGGAVLTLGYSLIAYAAVALWIVRRTSRELDVRTLVQASILILPLVAGFRALVWGMWVTGRYADVVPQLLGFTSVLIVIYLLVRLNLKLSKDRASP
ncbi:hypothetical protein [Methanopyrus kandleri]|uniref:Uncharacterized membrane protein specific for M.kandleri, MK-10 family n=1 Tax=Methanopyrus kandleri (strain AV19 / DSM 6324 / JCM 9639 / NBRC 100938) TaxID=190192 RepID=Q8TVN3_METKA|nr:hypothetical protein [Methanopyrus kandleri]AAM02568.1 Uncharacterized membrane protein specific for M.kandleri, MK-10 family [Methanopyrus kandleri AV19]